MTWAILLVAPPPGDSDITLDVSPTFYLGIEESSGRYLVTLKPRDKLSISASIQDLEQLFSQLPHETLLECVWGDYSGMNDAGNQRYRGILRNGTWQVDAAYPPISGEVLRNAVEFAGHLDHGCVRARSPEEAAALLDLFDKAMPGWADVVKPRIDGASISLDQGDLGELWNAAHLVFAVRYADTWAAWKWWESIYPDIRAWQPPGD